MKNRKIYKKGLLSVVLSAGIISNFAVKNVNAETVNFNNVSNTRNNISFRNADSSVREILPLDENENLLTTIKDKQPVKVKVIYENGNTEIRNVDDNFKYEPKNTDVSNLVNEVKEEFEKITYDSFYDILQPRVSSFEQLRIRTAFLKKNGRQPSAEELNAETRKYYLDSLDMERSFNLVKSDLEKILYSVLEHSTNANREYILNNKEKIMVALTLMERQYSFKFGNFSAKDLILYYPKIFGDDFNTLDILVNIGTTNYDGVFLANNTKIYETKISNITKQNDIISFIENTLPKFVENKDIDTWFKENSKAYIYETETSVGTSSLIEKMKNSVKVKSHLIPLLTLTSDYIYVISTMKTINYGLVDTYVDRNNYETFRNFKEIFEKTAIHQQKFLDFWYRITEKKDEFLGHNEIFVTDTMRKYGSNNERAENLWSAKYGEDAVGGVREFFTPLNMYVNYFGADGQANGKESISLFLAKVLEDRGQSTYTHELTHILDGNIWFNGYGRRETKSVEVYATGLFESVNNYNSGYAPIFNLNTAYTLGENRTQNKTPDRFQTDTDIKEYMSGVFDVLYTLDYLEGKVALEKSNADKTVLFNKVSMSVDPNKPERMNDNFENITEDEANSLNTIDDLVDNNIVSGRYVFKGISTVGVTRDNDYFVIPLFEPIYSGLQNPNGSTGDVTFRRNSYDILGEYGYTNGMVNYLSGKFSNDNDALNSILDGKYNGSLAEFKKDMFKRRIEKLENLKPTSYFNNLAELENLMRTAVETDLAKMKENKANGIYITNGVNAVRTLKEKIYKEYLNSTDDFRISIYNESTHNVKIKFVNDNNVLKEYDLEINKGENVENIESQIPTITDGIYKIAENFDIEVLKNITEDKTIEIPLVKVVNAMTIKTFDKEKIQKIEIVTAPTKTVYKEDQLLDLAGLVVKITDENGISKNISFTDFEEYKISVSKNLTEKLRVDENKFTLTVNEKTADISITVNVLAKNEKYEPTVSTEILSYKEDEDTTEITLLIFDKVNVDEKAGTTRKELISEVPTTVGENQEVRVKVIYDDETFDVVTVRVNVLKKDVKKHLVKIKFVNDNNVVKEYDLEINKGENVENIESQIPIIADGIYKIAESFDVESLKNITENKTIAIPLVKVVNATLIKEFNKEKIQKIEVITAPTKTVYNEDELLDLTGLVVKITDENGISKVVSTSDFEEYKITVSKNLMERLNVNEDKFTLIVNEKTVEIPITVNALAKNEKYEPIVSTEILNYKEDEEKNIIENKILEKITVDSDAGVVKKEIIGEIPNAIGENQEVRVKVIYDDETFDTVTVRVNVLKKDVKKYLVKIKFVNDNNVVKEYDLEINKGENVENIESQIPTIADGIYKIAEKFDIEVLKNITEDKIIEIPLVKVVNAMTIKTFDNEKIQKIEIVTVPTKTVYNEDQLLDLTGLVVKITDENGISKNVSFDKFVDYNILISPKIDKKLEITDKKIILTLNEKNVEIKIDVLEIQNVDDNKETNQNTDTSKDKDVEKTEDETNTNTDKLDEVINLDKGQTEVNEVKNISNNSNNSKENKKTLAKTSHGISTNIVLSVVSLFGLVKFNKKRNK